MTDDPHAEAVTALAERVAAMERAAGPTAKTVVPEGAEAAKARDIVLRQLSMMPRPRAVLAGKLKAKEIPDHVAEAVLDRYTELGLIDDQAYAELYVTAKHRDRGLGRYGLEAELRRQGVAEDDLRDAVTSIDTDAERRRATELIGKRLASALAAGPEAARRRLLGQLSRRGYPSSLAVSVVDEALDAAAHRGSA